jgi:dTMP kinase
VVALALAVTPFVAGAIGRHSIPVTDAMVLTYNGAAVTMLIAALLATVVGLLAWRQLDDRPGVPILRDLRRSFGRAPGVYPTSGFFIALEGGEDAGRSTQAALLGEWITEQAYDLLQTHEPAGTELGARLREIMLDPATGDLSQRTEALLYAAERAEQVDSVIKPALRRGAVVIADGYVDSALAYQAACQDLDIDKLELVDRWATAGLRPNLTIVLDLPATVEPGRFQGRDLIGAQGNEFHERRRLALLELAAAEPHHFLVLDATAPADEIAATIRAWLAAELPKP